MYKTTLSIEGMACGMCESHINDTIRNRFKVNKVSSSRKRGITEIISEDVLPQEELKKTVEEAGYGCRVQKTEPFEKKRSSLFGR